MHSALCIVHWAKMHWKNSTAGEKGRPTKEGEGAPPKEEKGRPKGGLGQPPSSFGAPLFPPW